jgi:hypothetical protein
MSTDLAQSAVRVCRVSKVGGEGEGVLGQHQGDEPNGFDTLAGIPAVAAQI